MILGALLATGPIFGAIATVAGMQRAFAALKPSGVTDPQRLSEPIGDVLVWTFAGFAAAALGAVIFIVSLIVFLNAKKSSPPSLPPRSS